MERAAGQKKIVIPRSTKSPRTKVCICTCRENHIQSLYPEKRNAGRLRTLILYMDSLIHNVPPKIHSSLCSYLCLCLDCFPFLITCPNLIIFLPFSTAYLVFVPVLVSSFHRSLSSFFVQSLPHGTHSICLPMVLSLQ